MTDVSHVTQLSTLLIPALIFFFHIYLSLFTHIHCLIHSLLHFSILFSFIDSPFTYAFISTYPHPLLHNSNFQTLSIYFSSLSCSNLYRIIHSSSFPIPSIHTGPFSSTHRHPIIY